MLMRSKVTYQSQGSSEVKLGGKCWFSLFGSTLSYFYVSYYDIGVPCKLLPPCQRDRASLLAVFLNSLLPVLWRERESRYPVTYYNDIISHGLKLRAFQSLPTKRLVCVKIGVIVTWLCNFSRVVFNHA